MAELHIKNLLCVKRQDPTGKDEATIRQVVGANSSVISGPHTLGRGDDVTLSNRVPFTGTITVQLMEEDNSGGTDDTLGTVIINENLAGTGDHTTRFLALANAEYEMRYDVHA